MRAFICEEGSTEKDVVSIVPCCGVLGEAALFFSNAFFAPHLFEPCGTKTTAFNFPGPQSRRLTGIPQIHESSALEVRGFEKVMHE